MNNKILSLIAATVLTLSASAASIKTDRTWYLAGEAMEVSVTADNALIAYVELCDTHGLVAGVVMGLKAHEATAIIELPPDLHSGYYQLSAYTRNDAQVSQQLVAIINPLRKSEDDDIEWVEVESSLECRVENLEFATAVPSAEGMAVANSTLYTLNSTPDTGGLAGGLEIDGHIIKARIKHVYDGNTFKANQILPSLSIIGKEIHYFEGKMVNDSIAVFNTFGVHGRQPLVLSAMSSTGVSLPIEMISPFATLLPTQLPHLVFHYNRSEVEARSIDMQRHQNSKPLLQVSGLRSLRSQASGEVTLPPQTVFGTKPDLSYNLDEYRQFHTIREVLLEYVNCVRKVDGQWSMINGQWSMVNDQRSSQLIVRRAEEHYNSSLPTLVLIDGMPVFDTERLLNYDARRIHFINIYGGQYTFGNGIYNGILSFVTRSGQLTNYPTEPNMQYLEYEFP